jgi:hypothetical protein
VPGDTPRFDLYDSQREFLIAAKRKEIHAEEKDDRCDQMRLEME